MKLHVTCNNCFFSQSFCWLIQSFQSTKISEDLKASLEKVTQERDAAMKERTEAMANYQENSMKLASKEQEVQNLKNEIEKFKEEVQKVSALTKNGEVDTERVRQQL